MQYVNLGFVFLPLTLIALDERVDIANRTQLPQYYYQFSISIYLFIPLKVRESSINMTRGDEDIETRSLKFYQPPLASSSVFLGAPPLLLVLK